MSDTTETETETATNTDTTDEPSKAELHDRVQQLESTVAKLMPSRRDALKLGAVGIAGAAGLGAASQTADASTGAAGTIGSSSDRPDAFLDEANVNQLTGVSVGGIKTKTRAFINSPSSSDPIPFNSVSYDPDNNFDTSTHEYIVPATGTYHISLNGRFEDSVSAGTRVRLEVTKNSTSLADVSFEATGGFNTASVTDVRELSSGDSITVANPLQVDINAGTDSTFLSIIRLE